MEWDKVVTFRQGVDLNWQVARWYRSTNFVLS